MQKKKFCMNIKKINKKEPFLMPLAKRILLIGMVPIYVSLFRLLSEIIGQAPFSAATAAYFGRALEYPLSALTVLTAITLIADRASREKTT